MKRPGAPYAAWRDGKLVTDLAPTPFAVDYAGTGFMMIRRSAFRKLKEAHPEWRYEEGHVGECWGFFQDPIEDGVHLSEDYFFCKRWRELGGEVLMHPEVKLKHHGAFAYG
jgi:GT2 family glycosyltransferase